VTCTYRLAGFNCCGFFGLRKK